MYATNTPANGGGPVQASGYLVDVDGNIQFPILGTIKVAGLTESALRMQIVRSLVDKKLLIDPVVTIRHLNFRVTVLGEVGNPTVISVPTEKITLLEALGLAGDVTIFGKRDNVMVIREENNKKIIKRLNLNTSEIFESPYYYLRSNDIVYVEPNKAKVSGSSRSTQLLPIILSGLSLTAIILDRVIR
jgi:polysaccharide export outer membrane protein